MKLFIIAIIIVLTTLYVLLLPESVASSGSVRKTLKDTSSLYIYEGLPHQRYEREELKKEKAENDTLEIGGFPFYIPKVQATKKSADVIKEILSSADSFSKFGGEKKCGGFHPDYAVAWTVDDDDYSILICYGCGEVMIISPKQIFRYDFHSAGVDKLKKVLAEFQLKRPVQKHLVEAYPIETPIPSESKIQEIDDSAR